MFIDNLKGLNGCVRDNYPCNKLIGALSLEPLIISCISGNECGRGYCCFYEQGSMSIDEKIKSEQG